MKNLLIIFGSNLIVLGALGLLNKIISSLHPRNLILSDLLGMSWPDLNTTVLISIVVIVAAIFTRFYSTNKFLILIVLSGILFYLLTIFFITFDSYDYDLRLSEKTGINLDRSFIGYFLEVRYWTSYLVQGSTALTSSVLLSLIVFKRKELHQILKII